MDNDQFPVSVRAELVGLTLRNQQAALEIARALEDAGVEAIFLKGVALSEWLYQGSEFRTYVDIDLLSAPGEIGAASAVLASLGFVAKYPETPDLELDRPTYVYAWRRPNDGVLVELHRTLTGLGASPERVWDVLSAQRTTVRFGEAELPVLDRGAQAFHVVVHAAVDGSRDEKPLEDLRRAISIGSSDDWKTAADIAERLDSTNLFAAGLQTVDTGPALRNQLQLPQDSSVKARVEQSTFPLEARQGALALEWFRGLPGWGARGRWVWGKVFPPKRFMEVWRPGSTSNPVSLFFAYAARPIWLGKQAIVGLWVRYRVGRPRS